MEENTQIENTAEEKPKTGFFARLKEGLKKTKEGFVKDMDVLFNGSYDLDEEFYEELEELLIMGDVGVNTTQDILEELEKEVDEKRIRDPKDCKQLLMDIMAKKVEAGAEPFSPVSPTVILMVGVNGVGKTTTVGKLAQKYVSEGKKVIIAAADTFRAAAVEQLREWANRADCDMIGGKEGNDPASVVYDAVSSAKAKSADVLLVDTAGRLHNKKNLMNELNKINRIVEREFPECHKETFCVLDATTGQNAVLQAREFNDAADLTGIVLTKMDGTAKGGIAIAVCSELDVPVRYIGVGEKQEDLQIFNGAEFSRALFDS